MSWRWTAKKREKKQSVSGQTFLWHHLPSWLSECTDSLVREVEYLKIGLQLRRFNELQLKLKVTSVQSSTAAASLLKSPSAMLWYLVKDEMFADERQCHMHLGHLLHTSNMQASGVWGLTQCLKSVNMLALLCPKKQVSMIREYHNHTPQTNPRHREEEPQNTGCYKTSRRQLNQSNQISLPHQDGCITRQTQSTE